MSIEIKIKKAHRLLVKNNLDFVVIFERADRFDEYDLDLYELTKKVLG